MSAVEKFMPLVCTQDELWLSWKNPKLTLYCLIDF
jgi:hypothetical protein